MSDTRREYPERQTFNVEEMRQRHANGERPMALASACRVCYSTILHHLGRRERQRLQRRRTYNVNAERRADPPALRRCQGYTAPYTQCTTITALPDCPTCGAMIWRPEAPLAPQEAAVEAPSHLLPRVCRRCHVAFQPRSTVHVFCGPCGRAREQDMTKQARANARLAAHRRRAADQGAA